MLKMSFQSYQKGVSLIEILVTTLILGIGLLGVAALQVTSISSNQEGFYTTQATSIARDYASRILSSKNSVNVPYNYTDLEMETPAASIKVGYDNFHASYHDDDGDASTTVPAFSCDATATAATKNCVGEGCNLAELAAYDKLDICKIAESTLPGGNVRVSANGLKLSITVDWDSSVARQDTGDVAIVNDSCEAITGSDSRNCIIMELVP